MKPKKFRIIDIVLIITITFGIFIVGALINLVTSSLPTFVNKLISENRSFLIYALIVVICLLVCLQYAREQLNKSNISDENSIVKARNEVIDRLHSLYSDKYRNKLDYRLKLNLTFKQTQLGIDSDYIAQHFLEDAKTNEDLQEALQYIQKKYQYLMVVGAPGSGKSTLLLDLALILLKNAREHIEEPLPVFLNLQSWTDGHDDFEKWVNYTLTHQYNLKSALVTENLNKYKLILLLDGLDEVGQGIARTAEKKSFQRKCLTAITSFFSQSHVIGAVISSRPDVFEDANLSIPVWAQITVNEIDRFFLRDAVGRVAKYPQLDNERSFSNPVAARNICWILDNLPNLANVLRIPFYFNLASQAFEQPESNKNIPDDEETFKLFLVDRFIKQTLAITRNSKLSNRRKEIRWLVNLANNATYQKDFLGSQNIFFKSGYFKSIDFGFMDGFPSNFSRRKLNTTLIVSCLFSSILACSYLIVYEIPLRPMILIVSCLTLSYYIYFQVWGALSKILIEKWIRYLSLLGQIFIFNVISRCLLSCIQILICEIFLHSFLTFEIISLILAMNVALIFVGFLDYFIKYVIFKGFLAKGIWYSSKPFLLKISFTLAILGIQSLLIFIFSIILSSSNKEINNYFLLLCCISSLNYIFNSTRPNVLKVIFWLKGLVPFNLKKFLNLATGYRILERDGKYFRFRHQIIQDYFVNFEKNAKSLKKYS